MVWSNDLAKLKQSLKADEGKSAPAPPAKTPTPKVHKSLEEEDAMFLTAMGKAILAPSKPTDGAGAGSGPKGQGAGSGSEFGEAMQDLKGLKPLEPKANVAAKPTKAPVGTDHKHTGGQHRVAASAASVATVATATRPPSDAHAAAVHPPPAMIHLAAGMTIDVDGVLDLRNHNQVDAAERLKERVLDGACLGWRAMHVILGNSEPLRQVVLDYMASPQAHPLSKYGEAPVPMGGANAWILYFFHGPDTTEQ
jgi:hypothetical protein